MCELVGRNNFFDVGYNIVNLTLENYKNGHVLWKKNNQFQDSGGIIMVYAGWCEVCHYIKDWFFQLSMLWENDLHFGGINSMHVEVGNDILSIKMGVEKYPTFILVERDGTFVRYIGKLDKEELYEWMAIFQSKILTERVGCLHLPP